jgi:hypothetical protein
MTLRETASHMAEWRSRIRRTLVIGALAYVLAALIFSTTDGIVVAISGWVDSLALLLPLLGGRDYGTGRFSCRLQGRARFTT